MIVIGIDPALGGGHAMVVADLGEQLTILDALAVHDLSQTEQQIDLLETFAVKYRPSVVVVEIDAQQKGLGNDERMKALGNRYGFSIRPHITRGKKLDEVFGVASMDQSFKRGEIRIPYGDQLSRDRMNPLIHQLESWRPPEKTASGQVRFATKNLRQDLVMALWFVWRIWIPTRDAVVTAPAPAWRPAGMFADPRFVGAT